MKPALDAYTDAGAFLSACGTWRYLLWREWADPLLQPGFYSRTRECVFVMCNPSTATGEEDDPTIRRCVGFARAWGFGRLQVVNLWAGRATKPRELARLQDPVGPDNLRHLEAALKLGGFMVAAWGALNEVPVRVKKGRVEEVVRLVTARAPLHAIRVTPGGSPEHPLYLPGQCRPVVWRAQAPGDGPC